MDGSLLDGAPTTRRTFAAQLRTIRVTTLVALRQVTEPHNVTLAREKADRLLTELEDRVRADGNSPDHLAEIRAARVELA